MLMRTDPFRDFDRLTQALMGAPGLAGHAPAYGDAERVVGERTYGTFSRQQISA